MELELNKFIRKKKSNSRLRHHKKLGINNRIKKQYLYNYYSKIIVNLFALILFITSYYFYYLSLEKCFSGIDACTQRWFWILTKVKQLVISVMIINFNIVLIIYKIISRFHIFHFVITFIYFYYYSHSSYYYDHGAFNLIFFFLFIFLFLLLLLIIKLIFCVSKIKSKIRLILVISLFICNYLFVNPENCDDWGKGLNNTYIENDNEKYGCRIVFPKHCYYKILQFSQDVSRLYMKSCENRDKNAKKRILKKSNSSYVNQSTTKIGFPLTNDNEAGRIDEGYYRILRQYVLNNLLDMDKPLPSGFQNPEYIVDFSKNPNGELIINLNYDEKLSKERKKLEQKANPYSENVLIIYLDALSRANSIRKMKKTLA